MDENFAATAAASAPQTPPGTTGEVHSVLKDFVSVSKRQLRAAAWPTLIYLTRTEVHTYAFSVAASAILSFFPFIVLLMTLVRRVFHSQTMLAVIVQVLRESLPSNQDFIVTSLQRLSRAQNGVQVISLIILLVSSTGVFMPLEVALNQVWGFRKNRSYLHNQAMALGLAFFCGALALVSTALTSGSQQLLQAAFGSTLKLSILEFAFERLAWLVMKLFAMCASITIFFVIYWVLPNGKVKARYVFPAAVVAGVLMEVAKYGYILALPLLDFREVYGPFSVSVTLMFWAFIGGMLLLGGAHLSAASRVEPPEDPERDLV